MSRSRPAQRRPPASLAGFPRTAVRRGRRIYRVARRAPWWFCSCGNCRFDLAPPDGTLYCGTDPLVGVVEVIGPEMEAGTISSRFLAERRIFSRRLSADLTLASLASRRAAGYGVTNELSTMTPYDIPRAWAAALRGAGPFDGVRYRTRFDTAASPRGLALFGTAGGRTWRSTDEGAAVRPEIVERLARECSITVADLPRLDQLDVRPAP